MASQSIKLSKVVAATAEQVFYTLTNSTALREWFSDTALTEPRTGGRVFFSWNDGSYAAGEYTAVEPQRRVNFFWMQRGESSPSEVGFDLAPAGAGTQVSLSLSGLPEKDETRLQNMQRSWERRMDNLQSILETGEDLRFVKRPMLGIGIDEFNPQIAAQLGVPVSEGIRLDSTVAGMGAEKAGLQKNDVLVDMGGIPLVGFNSLQSFLQKYHAGDEVEVVYYRGAEKQVVTMQLSQRPLPNIPWEPQALAEEVRKIQKESMGELNLLLDTVTEEQASFNPSPDEWNVKEILAHLIHTSREEQSALGFLLSGYEPNFDGYGGNERARITATVNVHPTVKLLRDELSRSLAELTELLAALPESFVQRKGSYWRTAYQALQNPFHIHTHLEQMRQAIEMSQAQ